MVLGEVEINTAIRDEIISFFTEVFDASRHDAGNGTVLQFSKDLGLRLRLLDDHENIVNNQMRVSFQLRDLLELEETHSNIQFFLYRRSEKRFGPSLIESDENRSFFIYTDLEQREWLFYCFKQ